MEPGQAEIINGYIGFGGALIGAAIGTLVTLYSTRKLIESTWEVNRQELNNHRDMHQEQIDEQWKLHRETVKEQWKLFEAQRNLQSQTSRNESIDKLIAQTKEIIALAAEANETWKACRTRADQTRLGPGQSPDVKFLEDFKPADEKRNELVMAFGRAVASAHSIQGPHGEYKGETELVDQVSSWFTSVELLMKVTSSDEFLAKDDFAKHLESLKQL